MFSPRTADGVMAGWCRWLVAAVLMAAVSVTIGCGKKDPFGRQPLEGFITWDGNPIKVGSITLEPAEGQPAGAMAQIRDGVFSIPRDAGPCPGKYNVWLHAYDHAGIRPADGSEIAPPKEILPPKFLKEPPTQVTIEKVDDKTPNQFKFDLK